MKFNKTTLTTVGVIILALIIILVGVNMTSDVSDSTPVSGAASITLLDSDASTVEVGDLQNVNWTSENYSAATVAVNIIRKVSDNPARYELVRTVAPATAADGSAVWVPAKTDVGTNTFVEVGCTLSAQECRGSQPTTALAVIDSGRYANTAATFEAIEQLNNK